MGKQSRVPLESIHPVFWSQDLCHNSTFARDWNADFDLPQLTRVRAANIEIEFIDAPRDVSTATNPVVAKFHPVEHEGPTSHGQVVSTADASLTVAPPSGTPSLGTGYSREVTIPLESKLHVHGVCSGRPTRNKVTWTIEEDRLKRDGMPREMCMAVIITRRQSRRFSAKVTVSAHYAVIRGQLAKMVPVIGKMDDPLYFDPIALEAAVDQSQTGPDGTLVAQNIGNLGDVSLPEFSTFKARPNTS